MAILIRGGSAARRAGVQRPRAEMKGGLLPGPSTALYSPPGPRTPPYRYNACNESELAASSLIIDVEPGVDGV